jgi:hypothetical protein
MSSKWDAAHRSRRLAVPGEDCAVPRGVYMPPIPTVVDPRDGEIATLKGRVAELEAAARHILRPGAKWTTGETHITRAATPCALCGEPIPAQTRVGKVRVGGDGTKAPGWRMAVACNRCVPVHRSPRAHEWETWADGPLVEGCPLCDEVRAQREKGNG